jgi:hypothetical protein
LLEDKLQAFTFKQQAAQIDPVLYEGTNNQVGLVSDFEAVAVDLVDDLDHQIKAEYARLHPLQ